MSSSSSSSSSRKRRWKETSGPVDTKRQQRSSKTQPISNNSRISAKQRKAAGFLATNGWVMYSFHRDDQRFFSSPKIQNIMESETFAGFCGANKVPEGGVVKDEYAQRVPRPDYATTQPRTTYKEIHRAWSSSSDKKQFTLPPAGYRTKRTEQGWQIIGLDRDRTGGYTPTRKHDTRMVSFGKAVFKSPTTRTLLEEGIEHVINRMLCQHMGSAAYTQLKEQHREQMQSHHLATPQVGPMPVSTSWVEGEIKCPTMSKPVKIKTVQANSPDTVRGALDLYLAQEYHRDYVDASCEVGCMTVLMTTACNARIAIIKDSHTSKGGEAYVAGVAQHPCNQTYVVIEIPPYTLLVMDSYLFHAGCRYFTDDHQKKQSHQIGATISYRSHHYIVPDEQVNPSNETGVKMKWW